MPGSTLGDAIDRALHALDALEALGQDVDDEWTYVTDLADAWRARLTAAAATGAERELDPAMDAAITAAIEETTRITDPHRAIDWLSTFPQVVLLAFGAPEGTG